MATTVSYSASLRTRKTTSSSNFKSDAAAQEYYVDDYNLVGIINFSGLSLAGKLITAVSFTFTADAAGYGDWYTKTVYLRKSLYQAASESNITGGGYYGDSLGTFTGSFYNNTTSYTMSGTLLTNIAAYLALGNNTFCIYNPSPVSSSNGYATNYLQWSAATITVTYEEAVSQPTVSASSVDMGSAVTIYTNRQSTSATHTLLYSFGGASGTIATGVGASYVWTPSVTLAQQIPSATAGTCTITCQTYYGATLTGTRTVSLTLTVPSSIIPSISNVAYTEAIAGLAAQFSGFVQSKSRLAIVISALGIQGSTISSYRAVLNGVTYSGDSFTSNVLTVAGDNTLTVTVTDSRGRTASTTRTVTVIAYTSPSLSQFSAERCNPVGTASQVDGVNVRVSAVASVSSVNGHNTMVCTIYYKLSTASSWISVLTPTITNYAVAITNQLLSATFDNLHSYDVMIRVTDWFGAVEQSVSIGTKQVLMDFYNDGSGIAFGKVAEETGKAAFGWPLSLDTPLAISEGGTGQTTAAGIRNALGLGNTTGAVPVANGGTGQTSLTSLRNAMGLGNTTGAVPIANGGTGAAIAADARTNLGITLAALGAAAASHTHAASAITSGTLAAARLPYKFAFGSSSVSGSSAAYLNYSSAGFASTPKVFVCYSTTSSNWSGDYGALKIYSKTTSGCYCVVGGTFSTSRAIDWVAIGLS